MASLATVSATPDVRRDERLRVRTILWDHSSLQSGVRATAPRAAAGARAASAGNPEPHPTSTTPATCGQRTVSSSGSVAVRIASGAPAGSRNPGFAGVGTCGSVWACPACNAKIAAQRAEDLAAAVREWERRGGWVALITLTNRHDLGQDLAYLLDTVTYAWSKTTSGRAWKADADAHGSWVTVPKRVVRPVAGAEPIVTSKLELIAKPVGYKREMVAKRMIPWARAIEVTRGEEFGWHVHAHALLFLRGDVDLGKLGASMFDRWSRALERKGMRPPIAGKGGLDIKRIEDPDELATGYLVKSTYAYSDPTTADAMGWEVAGGAMKDGRKGNRAAFRVLSDFVRNGDLDDLDLWHEYEKATRGRKQLTWAMGFRAFLELEDELTDQEIADAEVGDDDVQLIDQDEWRALRRHQGAIMHAADWLEESYLRSHKVTDWLIEMRRRQGTLTESVLSGNLDT